VGRADVGQPAFTAADRQGRGASVHAADRDPRADVGWGCPDLARELAARREVATSASTIRWWLADDALKPSSRGPGSRSATRSSRPRPRGCSTCTPGSRGPAARPRRRRPASTASQRALPRAARRPASAICPSSSRHRSLPGKLARQGRQPSDPPVSPYRPLADPQFCGDHHGRNPTSAAGSGISRTDSLEGGSLILCHA
jgi:hypothetical protein